ncbi:hypothetical protein SDC9_180453 [bioreactor metagenome]|uniref:Uncharacterized protein n=1 Tax=bioreactor metagenome TaxID=1076179 RepID=A0A645H2R4_9ZZZZ
MGTFQKFMTILIFIFKLISIKRNYEYDALHYCFYKLGVLVTYLYARPNNLLLYL